LLGAVPVVLAGQFFIKLNESRTERYRLTVCWDFSKNFSLTNEYKGRFSQVQRMKSLREYNRCIYEARHGLSITPVSQSLSL